MTARPKIGAITVCRSAAALLEKTIESVRNEPAVSHYVIVDGASTDGTSDIVSRYGRSVTTFISEADRGISDAMNKALALCSSDYIIFLHAGDVFLNNGALESVAALLERQPVDIVSCPVLLGDASTGRLAVPRGFNWWMRFKTGILHQGVVCSRRLFERIGGFDVSLKVAMDYEFFLRAYLAEATIRYHAAPLSSMAPGGLSWRRDWPSLRARLAEERLIHARYGNRLAWRVLYAAYWSLYPAYKYVRTWPHTPA